MLRVPQCKVRWRGSSTPAAPERVCSQEPGRSKQSTRWPTDNIWWYLLDYICLPYCKGCRQWKVLVDNQILSRGCSLDNLENSFCTLHIMQDILDTRCNAFFCLYISVNKKLLQFSLKICSECIKCFWTSQKFKEKSFLPSTPALHSGAGCLWVVQELIFGATMFGVTLTATLGATAALLLLPNNTINMFHSATTNRWS